MKCRLEHCVRREQAALGVQAGAPTDMEMEIWTLPSIQGLEALSRAQEALV